MWIGFTILFAVLCIAYCPLIIQYWSWFGRLKPFTELPPQTLVCKSSIVIPARNEATNIAACIESIYNNNYPAGHFEVIVVNDFQQIVQSDVVGELQKICFPRLLSLNDIVHNPINAYKKESNRNSHRQVGE